MAHKAIGHYKKIRDGFVLRDIEPVDLDEETDDEEEGLGDEMNNIREEFSNDED